MYAVIETGGKQYLVKPGEVIQVEKLEGEIGSPIELSQVLFFSHGSTEDTGVVLGKPYLSDAKVQTEIVGQGRGKKVLIVKMKRRKQYRRTQGHRQNYTQLLVTSVSNGTGQVQTLSSEEKEAKLKQFQSHLKAKGEAFSKRISGSRPRMAAKKAAEYERSKAGAGS